MIAESISGRFTSLLSPRTSFLVTSIFVSGCDPHTNFPTSSTMVVNPGFFRTELLTENSTNYAKTSIEDYKERNAQQHEFWKAQNGKQSGDPAKLAQALI